MLDLGIDVTDKSIKKWIEHNPRRMAVLNKKVVGLIAENIVAHTQRTKLIGQVLHRQTGKLSQALNWQYITDERAEVGGNLKYMRIHEYGGEIRPVNGKYLHFVIDGKHIMTKLVVMPKREYLKPSIEEVFDQGKAQKIFDHEIEKAMNEPL